MASRWRTWWAACLFLVLASCAPTKRSNALELSYWYWHSPFVLSKADKLTLREMGVHRLFVRAGTFTSDGKDITLRIPQKYSTDARGLAVHLVFNFDAGVVRHFAAYDIPKISKQVSERMARQVEIARAAGIDTEGVQLDLDCPTRLLGRYKELVLRIRSRPPFARNGGLQFSATALLSWLGSPGVQSLSDELDFIVPQAYEGTTGRTLGSMRPVSDREQFVRAMPLADRLRCPYFFGIPGYGHAFLFDEKDALVNIYRGPGSQEALDHPSFKLLVAYPADRLGRAARNSEAWVGEEILKFRAVRPAMDGRGLGYAVGFTVPTSELVRDYWTLVQEKSSPHCLGAIIYRMPGHEDSFALPLSEVSKVLRGVRPKPVLEVQLKTTVDNFDVIDSGSPKEAPPTEVFLDLTNIGDAPTFVSPDAVVIDVEFDHDGVDDVDRRDMDGVQWGALDAIGNFRESSRARATTVRFTKGFLDPQKKVFAGPIRLLSSEAQKATIRWKLRDASGFKVWAGVLRDVPLRKP